MQAVADDLLQLAAGPDQELVNVQEVLSFGEQFTKVAAAPAELPNLSTYGELTGKLWGEGVQEQLFREYAPLIG
ncbi:MULTISPECIES: hypothetical protein [unclassified Streptomyces]|uniref:hypothetical protein n=1 Tax=unclassified Streptomyces TaxID=2593676 RepID=UPI002365D4F0|nr:MULTISPECIES: hypothetical protein [unclassified Streptomyces]MDF3149114.1 hypothetical protein [Streptomyces sp. T21Q-yed]WDF43408.1 hypothetical protein PBV52_44835 [Streptomyces sp. T12]